MSVAYSLISDFYGSTKARRSQIPLMNHIDEGIIILEVLGASQEAIDAFCLHPMVQNDNDLMQNMTVLQQEDINPLTMIYVMEYRDKANRHLLSKQGEPITLSSLDEVNKMLIADKVQNRKDFLYFHYGTHEKSKELNLYFNEWLNALGVDEDMYISLVDKITN